jgi:uncharacterized membrane protein YccC
MTIVLVLKPDFATTFSRGVLRITGTLAGLVLATILFHLFPAGLAVRAGLLGLFVFILRWAGPANYGVFTLAVSAVIVLLIALTGVAPNDTIVARGLGTALGGAIALAAYASWPTWERSRVGDALADMLEGYRRYFEIVVRGRSHGGPALEAETDQRRLTARLARTNVEASLERLRAEPGSSGGQIDLLQRIMASSHRFAHAAMALEATPPLDSDGDGPAFARFAADVETTLAALAAAVRDDHALVRHDLPDLREAVYQLQHASSADTPPVPTDPPSNDPTDPNDPNVPVVPMSQVEADRIANSLITLTEQLIVWRSPSS